MTGAEHTAAPTPTAVPPDRDARLAELEARLDVRFRDRRLLDLALRHGSYGPVVPGEPRQSYERLELLGDAVLNLVVCDHLYHRYPEASEGDLAKLRARIVSEPWLARVASSLDLGRYILLGKGEEKAGGRARPALLADVLEAILGAVYVDSGYGVAHAVATRLLQDAFDALEEPSEDYKSELQELLQQRERRIPRYRIRGQEGPDHARVFVATVEAGGRILGEGRGPSKKQAEQAAARDALRRLTLRERTPAPAEEVPAAPAGDQAPAGAVSGGRRRRRRRHGRGHR
ncbi:MAG: ribonuclease III [Armatimonadota bacterium]|nr:ribonuclease III [Armatimonadota bacterium]